MHMNPSALWAPPLFWGGMNLQAMEIPKASLFRFANQMKPESYLS